MLEKTTPTALDPAQSTFATFASDNCAGVCPEAWEMMALANQGNVPAYGNDPWTKQVHTLIEDIFETRCKVFFTFNGTAANALSLASLCQSYHSVIGHQFAHVETDECGAPEFFSNGTKLLLAPGEHGKLSPEAVEAIVQRRNDVHFPKPRVVSVTQSTEMGTVYSLDELDAIGEMAQKHKLAFHMDGARFANAAASLNVPPKRLTWRRGVDVLCFGGTKNGMAVGDCVVFFREELADEFEYRCKQSGQLASKMRFLSAPWVGLLTEDIWLKNARHANQAAQQLEAGLKPLPGVEIRHPVESNAVFVKFDPQLAQQLRDKGWKFYDFIGPGESRLMCPWNVQQHHIDQFLTDAKSASESLSE